MEMQFPSLPLGLCMSLSARQKKGSCRGHCFLKDFRFSLLLCCFQHNRIIYCVFSFLLFAHIRSKFVIRVDTHSQRESPCVEKAGSHSTQVLEVTVLCRGAHCLHTGSLKEMPMRAHGALVEKFPLEMSLIFKNWLLLRPENAD